MTHSQPPSGVAPCTAGVCHAGSAARDQMKKGLCAYPACLHCSDLLIRSLRRVNVRLAQRIRASAGSHSVNG